MTFGGPFGTPLDDDLVTSFGGDGSNGTHVIKPFANLIATRSNGFTKDIGKSKIGPIGLSLKREIISEEYVYYYYRSLNVATYRVLLLRKRPPDGI